MSSSALSSTGVAGDDNKMSFADFLVWLADERKSAAYRAFTEKRFCSENVKFHDDFRKLRTADTDEKALQLSRDIYDTYLKVGV